RRGRHHGRRGHDGFRGDDRCRRHGCRRARWHGRRGGCRWTRGSGGNRRRRLWHQLNQAVPGEFDFGGSRKGDPGCTFTGYDQHNEGHGGYILADILKATSTGRPGGADSSDPFDSSAKDLATWFDGRPADLVLMHFGTNDVWNSIAPATITNAYTAILNKLR